MEGSLRGAVGNPRPPRRVQAHVIVALLALACTAEPPPVELAPAATTPADLQPGAAAPDTVLLAWIPYDNDLGPFAGPVLQGLRDGSAGGVEVLVQLDRPDQPGMERAVFRDGALAEERVVEAEDSGSIEAFAAFLDHAAARYEARAYGVVIMDHGGDLFRVARDDAPAPGPAPAQLTWLQVDDIARELTRFRTEESGEVELLALQVCGKASIEPLRILAPAARHLLASQLPLAAPNTWYRDGLRQIGAHPEWTGADWVAAVAGTDEPRMYAGVSCFRSEALAALPPLDLDLDPALLDGPLAPVTWAYAGEGYVDLAAALRASGQDPAVLAPLSCGHHVSPAPAPLLTEGFPDHRLLSGLSAALRPDAEGRLRLDPSPVVAP